MTVGQRVDPAELWGRGQSNLRQDDIVVALATLVGDLERRATDAKHRALRKAIEGADDRICTVILDDYELIADNAREAKSRIEGDVAECDRSDHVQLVLADACCDTIQLNNKSRPGCERGILARQ